MHNLTLEQIKDKILKSTKLTKEELEAKIKAKLDALSGLISAEGAAHIIANEYKIQLYDPKAALKIDTLQAGLRNIEITGKVLRIYETRKFSRDGEERQVANFLIADDSGIIRVVAWNERANDIKKLKEGDVIRVRNGYVRENRDRIEIHCNDSAEIGINPEGVTVENAKQLQQRDQQVLQYERKKISELEGNEYTVELLGTVVQLYDPKFFEVCPQCSKRAREQEGKYVCAEHGIVEPVYKSVLNVFLDDGSDNIQCVLWQDQIKEAFGLDDAGLDAIRNDISKFEEPKNGLLGKILLVKGAAKLNTMFNRMEFNVRELEANPSPQKEINKLEGELHKARDETLKEADTSKGFEPAAKVKPDEKMEQIAKENQKLASNDDEMLDIEDVEDV